MTLDGSKVEVINWEKYNPRTDAKRPVWFRMDNTLATGPAFHDLDCEQKWLWVVILSLVSQKNGEPIVWKSSYIQAITGIKPKKQNETIELFEKFVRLRVSRKVTSSLIGDSVHDSPTTYERTNEHNEQDITNTATSRDAMVAHPELLTLPTQDILEKISREMQDTWVTTYGDLNWIRGELARAWSWCKANPQKAPKSNWARFVNGWLSRGWESHRKGLPPNRAEQRTQGNLASLGAYIDEVSGNG